MKEGSKRTGFGPEESKRQQPSLHDLYFTEDIDIEEELRLMEADPKLKGITGDSGTLDKIKAEWAKMNMDVEMSEEISDITAMVPKKKDININNEESKVANAHMTEMMSEGEWAGLSPEARALIELGMKVKSEESEDEPKERVVRKRSKRVFFAVAAIIVLSMAASTTGVTSLYKYLQVEDKGAENQYRFVDSESDMVLAVVNEVEIYQEVDKFFGAPVVKLYGELTGLEFQYVNYFEEDMSVDMVYGYEEKRIFYSVQSNYNQLSQMSGVEESLLDNWKETKEQVNIAVEKHSESNTTQYYYIMSFEYNGFYYKIVACNVEESIIKNIIEKLHF